MRAVAALLMAVALAACALITPAAAAECEVCVKVVDDIMEARKEAGKKGTPKMEEFEKLVDNYCGTVDGWGGKSGKKDIGEKEKKLCYSVSPIKRELARPVSLGLPALKACQRASAKDESICDIRFPKPPPDLTTMDMAEVEKMRVRQLKDLLKELGKSDKCKGCTEKSDFVDLIKKLRDEQAKAKGKEL